MRTRKSVPNLNSSTSSHLRSFDYSYNKTRLEDIKEEVSRKSTSLSPEKKKERPNDERASTSVDKGGNRDPIEMVFRMFKNKQEDWKGFFNSFLKNREELVFITKAPTFRVIFDIVSPSTTARSIHNFLENEKFIILLGENYCGTHMEKIRFFKSCKQRFRLKSIQNIETRTKELKSFIKQEVQQSKVYELDPEIFSSESSEISLEDQNDPASINQNQKKRTLKPISTSTVKMKPISKKSSTGNSRRNGKSVTFKVTYPDKPTKESKEDSRRSERLARRSKTPYHNKFNEANSSSERESVEQEGRESPDNRRRSLRLRTKKQLQFELVSPKGRTRTSFSTSVID